MAKSTYLINLEKYLNSPTFKKRQKPERTELYLKSAAQYIRDLEKDANSALIKEKDKTIDDLTAMIERNNQTYKQREKDFIQLMEKKEKKIKDLYKRLPREEKLKETFICFSCDLEWSKEFLRLVDKKGNQFCYKCIDGGIGEAGKEIGQKLSIETEISQSIKTFNCEFCRTTDEGEPVYLHVKNMPDGRSSREISRLCLGCASNRAQKDLSINYCPRKNRPRDDYEGNEYDCNCPRTDLFAY